MEQTIIPSQSSSNTWVRNHGNVNFGLSPYS